MPSQSKRHRPYRNTRCPGFQLRALCATMDGAVRRVFAVVGQQIVATGFMPLSLVQGSSPVLQRNTGHMQPLTRAKLFFTAECDRLEVRRLYASQTLFAGTQCLRVDVGSCNLSCYPLISSRLAAKDNQTRLIVTYQMFRSNNQASRFMPLKPHSRWTAGKLAGWFPV